MKTTHQEPRTKRRDRTTVLVAATLSIFNAAYLFVPLTLAQESARPPGQFDPSGSLGEDRRQGPPSPAVMARNLLAEFDLDGDDRLALAELTAALEALHQRRPHGPPPSQGEQGDTPGDRRPYGPPPGSGQGR